MSLHGHSPNRSAVIWEDWTRSLKMWTWSDPCVFRSSVRVISKYCRFSLLISSWLCRIEEVLIIESFEKSIVVIENCFNDPLVPSIEGSKSFIVPNRLDSDGVSQRHQNSEFQLIAIAPQPSNRGLNLVSTPNRSERLTNAFPFPV